jgi:hypothetical protein
MVEDRKYIDCRAIPNEELVRFRKLAVESVMEAAPTFGEWLRKWCETEELWRRQNPQNRPAKHLIALPPACEWTNRELSQALRAVTNLSYIPQHGTFDTFIDRIVLVVTEEAADRLEKA